LVVPGGNDKKHVGYPPIRIVIAGAEIDSCERPPLESNTTQSLSDVSSITGDSRTTYDGPYSLLHHPNPPCPTYFSEAVGTIVGNFWFPPYYGHGYHAVEQKVVWSSGFDVKIVYTIDTLPSTTGPTGG
jgi:hypothetical protein